MKRHRDLPGVLAIQRIDQNAVLAVRTLDLKVFRELIRILAVRVFHLLLLFFGIKIDDRIWKEQGISALCKGASVRLDRGDFSLRICGDLKLYFRIRIIRIGLEHIFGSTAGRISPSRRILLLLSCGIPAGFLLTGRGRKHHGGAKKERSGAGGFA